MSSLASLSPCAGHLPIRHGGLVLTEAMPARITQIAPLRDRDAELSAALRTMGLGWPAPGRSHVRGEAGCLWSGRGQAFLVNADPAPLTGLAAIVDQSDGWAVMRLSGPGADEALARLVPVDLAGLARGQVARSLLGHMMALLRRTGAQELEVWVFRSMAATAVHEIGTAMRSLAARAALAP